MKKIKVYLQYPWKFPDSPYYKYLIDNPPENIEFLNAEKQKGVIVNKKLFWFSNFLKRNICRFINSFKLSIPNAHLSQKGNYDLIHCAHCLSRNKNKPWVVDIESKWQFYIGNKTKRAKEKVKKILISNNCKKILPWTQITANEIIKEFPEIKEKVEVVYPSVSITKIKRKKHEDINLLFVARYFYEKGGLHALEVIDRLTKKYNNVKGTIVSEVPKSVLKKYSKNRKIKFFGLMSQEKLFELMRNSDLFLYPGSVDTFGFSLLEAMAFGLPIITINTKGTRSRKEIIENNKTGLIFDVKEKLIRGEDEEKKVIDKLVDNSAKLIKNDSLREKMSKGCIFEINSGRFSIKKRNEKLKKIYREALK